MATDQIDQALADQMLEKAVAACAQKYFNGNIEWSYQALRQGRADICSELSRNLSRQIAAYLGNIDKTVKAIFEYTPDEAGARLPEIEKAAYAWRCSINLVAWVERKSAALNALVSTLKITLTESQRRLIWGPHSASGIELDLEMVADEEVYEQRGLGVVAGHERIRSSQVWPQTPEPEIVISDQPGGESQEALLALLARFDPGMAPESRILEHAYAIEAIPPAKRGALEYHLTELKVGLIRKLISDQLSYINIARQWFTTADLENITRRRIGLGRIGGKAAGMLLAARILHEVADDEVRACLQVPESYFLGSDLLYIFSAMNGLMHWNEQKYKPEEQIRAEYAQIQAEFLAGEFPPEILAELRAILEAIGSQPVIVRSSSQLEDNFGTSFAGKYESFFCPNQGSPTQNLEELTRAIKGTYASTLKPDALLYRRRKGLQDYDERMAVLIQTVQGEPFGRYFLPHIAGVAFSHNIFRWSPQIRREDGFARLVWGLGTRAVGRVGDDYPRLVALSHPLLQPDASSEAIQRYSQHYVDVIDLQANRFVTLPVHQVLSPDYRPLRHIAQLEQDGFFATPRMRVGSEQIPRLAITFDEFLRRTPFATCLSKILRTIETHYHAAVDLEFTVQIDPAPGANPMLKLSLLQCRPQTYLQETKVVRLPEQQPPENILFSTRFMVPCGALTGIRYLLYVDPERYYALATPADRSKIGAAISRLNAALGEKSFICIGPGRWGSTNTDLGVYVSYADIYNAGALVELSGAGIGPDPEPSLGTHFFQDLMEANIFPLAVRVDDKNTIFNRAMLEYSPNRIGDWVEIDAALAGCLRLIDTADLRAGHHLELVMDDEAGQALAFLASDAGS